MPDVLVEPSVLVGVSSVDGAVSVCRRGLAFSGRTGGGPCRLFAPALVAELVRRTLRRSERRRGWLGRLTAGRILGAILGAELSDIPRHQATPISTTKRESPARSARADMRWHTMSWQDAIRDVEAGGSNPLTPSNRPPADHAGDTRTGHQGGASVSSVMTSAPVSSYDTTSQNVPVPPPVNVSDISNATPSGLWTS